MKSQYIFTGITFIISWLMWTMTQNLGIVVMFHIFFRYAYVYWFEIEINPRRLLWYTLHLIAELSAFMIAQGVGGLAGILFSWGLLGIMILFRKELFSPGEI